MDKAGNGVSKNTKRALEDILKNRKKPKKSKMVVAVSNGDDVDDFFTWEEYLKKCRAKAVPETVFKHVPSSDSKESGFKPGMKVEAKDSSSMINSYWVATVVMASGPLLLLRFDGYDNDRSGDFWVNVSSQLIQPIGWCAKTCNVLKPPEAIKHKEKNWALFLINNLKNAIAAPDKLFRKSLEEDNKNLKIGAKLEVQDSENPLCYWVASVVEIFGLRLRLRFEGYENEDGDIWEYLLSDRLHNLGWSKLMKMVLRPPKVMEKYQKWAVFRKVTEMCLSHCGTEQTTKKQESTIPVNNGFKPGMKLEAVNPENPLLICAATVRDILDNHFFTVEIDSVAATAETLKFVCHSKSKYIFPVGWCEKNNVKLTPPKGSLCKSFNWKSYLDSTNGEAVPESLFDKDLVKQKPICLSDLNQIKLGLNMEILNQDDPSTFWVGEVVKSVGFKLYIHLQGEYSRTDHTIEVHYLSESVHHLGWGFQAGLQLKPPKSLKAEWHDEKELLVELYKLGSALRNYSLKLKKEDSPPDMHCFKEGMQLEAVNPQDPSSICVASVKKVINEFYFTVQIDSLINNVKDKNIVFWCHAMSRNIFPVGWCDKNKLQLTPPPGYSNKEFRWDEYMESMQTKAAPEMLFSQDIPSSMHLFIIAQKLEAVDQTKPETISVATVTQVVGRTIWVRLDGYPSNAVEHIYDVDSYDLLPVGWCSTYGHPLLTPHQKKKEPETRRWVASLRKRATDSRVSTTTDSSRKRRKTGSSSSSKEIKELQRKEEKRKSIPTSTKESRRVSSTVSASQQTPSSSTTDDSSRQSDGVIDVVELESDMDTASESGQKPTTTIDLTDDNDFTCPPDHIRLFVKKSCSCGPYVDNMKLLCLMPDIIGPAPPNTILRKVVENLVRCSHSAENVLQLLASEKEKKSFLSIIKTIVSKLSLCENLLSLHLIQECASCDKGVTQSKDSEETNSSTIANPSSTTAGTPLPNSTTKHLSPAAQDPKQQPITKTTPTVDATIPNNTSKQITPISQQQPILKTAIPSIDVRPSNITTRQISQSPKQQPIQKTPPPSFDVRPSNITTRQMTQSPKQQPIQKTPPPSIDVRPSNTTTRQISQSPKQQPIQKTPPPSFDVRPSNTTTRQMTQSPKQQPIQKTPPPSIDVRPSNTTTRQISQSPKQQPIQKTPPPSFDVRPSNITTRQISQSPKQQPIQKTPPPSFDVRPSNITTRQITQSPKQQPIQKTPPPSIDVTQLNSTTKQITPDPKQTLKKTPPPSPSDVTQPNSTTIQITPIAQNSKQQPLKKPPPPPQTTDVTQPNSTTKQITPKEGHPTHNFKKKTPPPPPYHDDRQSTSICIDDDDDYDDDEEEEEEEDKITGKIPKGHISTWSTADVVEFITPRDCKRFANIFLEQEVDGKALMLLSLDDIHKVLGVTLGPAIKLHDDVQKLRRRQR